MSTPLSISPSDFAPESPFTPEFCQHVLDQLPTAVIVLAADGTIVYGNEAAAELSGWTLEETVGQPIFELIHPEDVVSAIDAFCDVLDEAAHADRSSPWAPVRFRARNRTGGYATVEVTGVNALGDPMVDGLIYSLRSCRDDELVDEIFSAVAASQPVDNAVPPIIQRLLLPPLRFEAAVYEVDASGHVRCVDSSHPTLRNLPFRREDAVPWGGLDTGPARVDVTALPPAISAAIGNAGFGAVFYAASHAPDLARSLVIVAATHEPHDAAKGPFDRLRRAQDSLTTVLLRAHHDRSIRNDAHRDDLTGLPNRLALHHLIEPLAQRTDDAAMLFVDVDGFKAVNDEHGHQFGDRVLTAIAGRLERAARPQDFVCRLGGDEFAIVVTDGQGRLTDHTIRTLADSVVAALADPISFDGELIPVGASVGVARLGADRDVDMLIGHADAAMYRAKRAGGGRHHVDHDSAA